jgi:hypothetical protein
MSTGGSSSQRRKWPGRKVACTVPALSERNEVTTKYLRISDNESRFEHATTMKKQLTATLIQFTYFNIWATEGGSGLLMFKIFQSLDEDLNQTPPK